MIDDDAPDETGEADPQPDPSAPPNAADRRSIRKQRVNAKLREEQARTFWRDVFGTETGRREMWGILEAGHAFDERFAAGPTGFPQPEATWCHAGEQRLAFRLYRSWLRLAPEGVGLMMAENDPALAEAAKR